MKLEDVKAGTILISKTGMCGNFLDFATVDRFETTRWGNQLVVTMSDGNKSSVSNVSESGSGWTVASERELLAIEDGMIPNYDARDEEAVRLRSLLELDAERAASPR